MIHKVVFNRPRFRIGCSYKTRILGRFGYLGGESLAQRLLRREKVKLGQFLPKSGTLFKVFGAEKLSNYRFWTNPP